MNPAGQTLPARLTSFVGRTADCAALVDRLAQRRLVTIAGPGGAGKSRLAYHVAADIADRLDHEVWVVDLVATPGDRLAAACLAALRVAPTPSREHIDVLTDHLADRDCLLLLDNCDRIVGPAGQLAHRVLSVCPHVRILTTSRTPLEVGGETVWHLEGLPVDAPDGTIPDAVHLLLDRLGDLDPRLARHPDPDMLQPLCRRVDGLPLAIELAAARLLSFTPAEILARFDRPGRPLAQLDEDGDPRHGSIGTMVDWTFELLDPTDQEVFLRLGTFAGPFDRGLAHQVAAPDLDDDTVDRTLHRLVRHSLVTRLTTSPDGRARFRLLETMRWYARGRLTDTGVFDSARQAHAAAFTDLAWEAFDHLFSADQRRWLDRLERHHDDLRAAIDWALETGDAAVAQQLTGPLARFWDLHGHYDEGLRRSRQACALPGPVPASVAALAHNGVATLAVLSGDSAAAENALASAERTAREAGDDANLAYALQYRGLLALAAADVDVAEPLLIESEAASIRAHEPALEAMAAIFQVERFVQLRDLDQAEVTADRAQAAVDRAGDAETAGWNELGRALIANDRHDPATAAGHVAVATDLFATLGARWGLSAAGAIAATAHGLAGQWEHAVAVARRSELLRETIAAVALPSWGSRMGTTLTTARTRLGHARWTAVWDAAGQVAPVDLVNQVITDGTQLVDMTSSAADDTHQAVATRATLRRDHDVWEVGWAGHTGRIHHRVGLSHLAVLLANPDQPVAALELATRRPLPGTNRDPDLTPASDGTGPLLDTTATRAYRDRLAQLQTELDQAHHWHDPERAARARTEMDAISEQLLAAVGLSGRPRTAASDTERARKAITKALRAAIDQIRQVDHDLAHHLDTAIQTGTWCTYRPDPTSPVTWDVRTSS